MDERRLMRRVGGYHDIRLDGISDVLFRARGASVLDIGCNRGLVGFEFANNGAAVVHGCDNYEQGIATAREWFTDLRNCQSRFEVVDLTRGGVSLKPFEGDPYDIVLLLATLHKLWRKMKPELLKELIGCIGNLTKHYLCWKGGSSMRDDQIEIEFLDRELGAVGLKRIQTSYISEVGASAIWAKR